MPLDPLNPRKSPRQSRSRALVEALLIATARVLERHGAAGATTTRIAETAGVSIGSLYQYFPNREALIGALIEAEAERLATAVETLLDEMAAAPAAATIERLVALVFDEKRLSPQLHVLLNAETGRVRRDAAARMAANRITLAIEGWLFAQRAALVHTDPTRTAVVVESVLEGVAHKAAQQSGRERELLRGEVEWLLRGYLMPK